MTAAVLARPRPSPTRSIPPRTVLVRECDRHPDLFDLPESPSADADYGPLASTNGVDTTLITFSDIDAEAADNQRFAAAATKAVNACKNCPFLATCQKEAYERLASGQRPQNEVVAAVAFNNSGLPEPAVHNRPRLKQLDQLTFDMDFELAEQAGDSYTEWVPADLSPISFADDMAVAIALDEERVNTTVTQSHLDANPDVAADGRIVLSYADEWAILRRGLERGVSRYRISQILGCTWQRASEMAHILGCGSEGAFEPSEWVDSRRAIYVADYEYATRRAYAAATEQRDRDIQEIRRHRVYDMIETLAERRGIRIHSMPRPLSSRVKRTVAVALSSSSIQGSNALRCYGRA